MSKARTEDLSLLWSTYQLLAPSLLFAVSVQVKDIGGARKDCSKLHQIVLTLIYTCNKSVTNRME